MAWLGLLFLLVTTMLVLSALGAQHNFRRAAGAPPPDPAEVFRDWPEYEGVALTRAQRLSRTRLGVRGEVALRSRSFSGAF
jgi:hypothetical protein